MKRKLFSAVAEELSVEVAIRQELYALHRDLEKEINKFSLLSSEILKMKRLLFLFQRDLLPGINGEILESKESRENIILSPISSVIKLTGWFSLALLNAGMLFYIFLFAFSQDNHSQKAWGRSFAIWLLLEILLISTGMVVFMHIFLPSLILTDVAQIKKKMTETINNYYESLIIEEEKKQDETSGGRDDEEEEENLSVKKKEKRQSQEIEKEKEKEKQSKSQGKGIIVVKATDEIQPFNAAKFLFLSFRLASIFPELKASQIVLQFSSPWPRQSYQHIIDVKKKYDDRYTAVSRSASIILIFFLTNLLSVPLAIQDMILSLIMAVTMGYTILLHLRLFNIFPALIMIPTIVILILIYLISLLMKLKKSQDQVKSLTMKLTKRERKQQQQRKQMDDDDSGRLVEYPRREIKLLSDHSSSTVVPVIAVPVITQSSVVNQHQTRRQSLNHGINLTSQLRGIIQENQVESEDDDEQDAKEHEHEEQKKGRSSLRKKNSELSSKRSSSVSSSAFHSNDLSDDFLDDFQEFDDVVPVVLPSQMAGQPSSSSFTSSILADSEEDESKHDSSDTRRKVSDKSDHDDDKDDSESLGDSFNLDDDSHSSSELSSEEY
jgi:predicted Holliday junction resolvase-like endonuclease